MDLQSHTIIMQGMCCCNIRQLFVLPHSISREIGKTQIKKYIFTDLKANSIQAYGGILHHFSLCSPLSVALCLSYCVATSFSLHCHHVWLLESTFTESEAVITVYVNIVKVYTRLGHTQSTYRELADRAQAVKIHTDIADTVNVHSQAHYTHTHTKHSQPAYAY